MTTEASPKSYLRTRPGFTYAGPDGRFYATAEETEALEVAIIAARDSQDGLDESPSRVPVDGDDLGDPGESPETLPDSHYADLTPWQRKVLDSRYGDLGEDEQRRYDLEKTEFDMETPVDDKDAQEAPTAPIGRPSAGRSRTRTEPQTSFNEEVIDVENGEAEWYRALQVRESNKDAAKVFGAANREIQAGLARMGYEDGKGHIIRAGEFLIQRAADGEGVEIEAKDSFICTPKGRTTIKKDS